MSRCKKCGCQIESPFDGNTIIHNVEACMKFTGDPAPTHRSSTATLIKALEVMAKEDRSEDGIAGAALLEASQRLREMDRALRGVIACCDHLHHEPRQRHKSSEECPVERLIQDARAVSR